MRRVIHVGELDLKRATGTGESIRGLVAATEDLVEHSVCSLSRDHALEEVAGLNVRGLRGSPLVRHLQGNADLVHFHGAFVPRLRWISRQLSLPYVVTPHGGYREPVVQRRRSLLKRLYLRIWERKFLARAEAVCALTDAEASDLTRIAPGANVVVVPNAIEGLTEAEPDLRRQVNDGPLTFLGRGDVHHKGLDRLASVARAVPEAHFDAYVVPVEREATALEQLRQAQPPNLRLRDPVYGEAKAQALRNSIAYVQFSRFEAFGMSLVEAAASGKPLILSAEMDLAASAHHAGAALLVTFPPSSVQATPGSITEIHDLITNEEALRRMGDAARSWALKNFSPLAVRRQAGIAYGITLV